MAICKICGKNHFLISENLKLCSNCIKEKYILSESQIEEIHQKSRINYKLPPKPPKEKEGVQCKICSNECKISIGQYGYCGIRKNESGRIIVPKHNEGKLSCYLDPLPTNCVADWVCPGGTGEGYPYFSYNNGPEYRYYNLAVFFHACSFNCLYCQNWHFKKETFSSKTKNIEEILNLLSPKVSCICYFGGDPAVQIVFALNASRQALKRKKGKILRICWETNGSVNKEYLEKMVELSLASGGCIKFDLKAWTESIHIALTGVSNKRTLDNFEILAKYITKRPKPPLLIASTLLVPGYVDEEEVRSIAKFIFSLNSEIPYRILAFYPQFYMNDLPTTSRELAYRCYDVAKTTGLKNVSIGNVHLLK